MEPAPVLIESAKPPETGAGPPPLGAKRAIWLFAAYVLVQIGVGLIGGFAVGIYGAALQMSPEELSELISGDALFPIALACILASGAVAFALVRRSYPGPVREGVLAPVGWKATPMTAALTASALGALLAFLFTHVAVVAFPPDPAQEFGPLTTAATVSEGWVKFVWVVLLLVAAPIEEFLFRGAMLTGFARSLGSAWAGLIVTSLFVLCHLPETNLYYPAVASIALLGLCTLVARQRTGSLIAPICLHAAYNSVIAIGTSG